MLFLPTYYSYSKSTDWLAWAKLFNRTTVLAKLSLSTWRIRGTAGEYNNNYNYNIVRLHRVLISASGRRWRISRRNVRPVVCLSRQIALPPPPKLSAKLTRRRVILHRFHAGSRDLTPGELGPIAGFSRSDHIIRIIARLCTRGIMKTPFRPTQCRKSRCSLQRFGSAAFDGFDELQIIIPLESGTNHPQAKRENLISVRALVFNYFP